MSSCLSCIHDYSVYMTTKKRSHEIDKLRSRITLYNENHLFDYKFIKSIITYDLQSKFDVFIVVDTTLYLLNVRNIIQNMTHIVTKNRRELII